MKLQKIKQRKAICIFESIGGKDKGPDGHRKDTLPIAGAIKALGWKCDVIKFQNEKADQIFNDVVAIYSGYIPRINPGSLSDNQKIFQDVLRKLSSAGLVGMTHPDTMINFGSKSILATLNKSGLVPQDTSVYYQVDVFKKNFPVSLSYGQRVLKQNRGSTGEGIWKVAIQEQIKYQVGQPIPLETKIKCTEASDNHVQHRKLGQFMDFCQKYIIGDLGMLVDMKYLPRIKEGEIRILMIGKKPTFVIHKKPAQSPDAFSATLFSGAKYTYETPEKWQNLVKFFLSKLEQIKHIVKEKEFPLIWTADFILDTDENKNDKYVLGEFNCSCVGFTTHLESGIQQAIAQQAINQCQK